MCGRLNIIDDPLYRLVKKQLGIEFYASTNSNLSPGQIVSTITRDDTEYRQMDTVWGIKPEWSKRLIINAQAETVAEKPTFKYSLLTRRCLIPCSGWYEWRTENGIKKKYLFSDVDQRPLYMAGIWYEGEIPQLVTLTTSPNERCLQYHNRMPALILPENIDYWFQSPPDKLHPILLPISDNLIRVESVA